MTDDELALQTERVRQANLIKNNLSKLSNAILELEGTFKEIHVQVQYEEVYLDTIRILDSTYFPKLKSRILIILKNEIQKEIDLITGQLSDI